MRRKDFKPTPAPSGNGRYTNQVIAFDWKDEEREREKIARELSREINAGDTDCVHSTWVDLDTGEVRTAYVKAFKVGSRQFYGHEWGNGFKHYACYERLYPNIIKETRIILREPSETQLKSMLRHFHRAGMADTSNIELFKKLGLETETQVTEKYIEVYDFFENRPTYETITEQTFISLISKFNTKWIDLPF